MESSRRRSLIDDQQQDLNLSTFRRRNKIIAAVFILLIISLTLLITAAVSQLLPDEPAGTPPLLEFCSGQNAPTCLKTFRPIIAGKSISEPDQILAISLQTAARIINTSLTHTHKSASNNCSDSLRRGLGRVRQSLSAMRVNPFVGAWGKEQRDEMAGGIAAAEDDVQSCLDDLAENGSPESVGEMARLFDSQEYLTGAVDFVAGAGVGRVRIVEVVEHHLFHRRVTFDFLLVCGLQLLFVLGLFCSLFRTR